jgi:hypothetical protein
VISIQAICGGIPGIVAESARSGPVQQVQPSWQCAAESPGCWHPLLVPERRQAITDASERVAQAAWIAARLDPWSPSISVSSWRRIAAAGIATSHHCHVLLAILANRTSHLGSAELSKQLKAAAGQVWLTHDSWRLSALPERRDHGREVAGVGSDQVRGHGGHALLPERLLGARHQ